MVWQQILVYEERKRSNGDDIWSDSLLSAYSQVVKDQKPISCPVVEQEMMNRHNGRGGGKDQKDVG